MILDCLEKVLHRDHLTAEEASAVMGEILSGQATPAQMAALLVALSMKGETEEELLGMAQVLRGKICLAQQYGPVDVGLAGTGRKMLPPLSEGSSQKAAAPASLFPVALAAAFVIAGAGVRVLQQGCRFSIDEPASSAVLESLGVSTEMPASRIARSVAEVGLGFLFEPLAREAMEPLRFALHDIPVPTAFDLLLPMLNPGGAPALVLGVHSAALAETVAGVLARLEVRRAFVIHGSDGLDVMTNTGPAVLAEVQQTRIQMHRIEAGDFGLPAGRLEELEGGDARQSAGQILSVLRGEGGSRRNAVLLNAAPGIVCGGKPNNLAEGVRTAAEAIDAGRALRVLESLSRFTHAS